MAREATEGGTVALSPSELTEPPKLLQAAMGLTVTEACTAATWGTVHACSFPSGGRTRCPASRRQGEARA